MLNVFVSSTFEDLKEHRKQVSALINSLGLNDIAMERWPAAPNPPYREIEKALRESNIFLGIVGWKQGSSIPDLRKTYVRFEYECAQALPLPILMFLTDPAAPVLPNQIDRGRGSNAIDKFRKQIENEKDFVWAYFTDPLHLVRLVSGSLFRMLAGTKEFQALSSGNQLILELRQVLQTDFLTRLNQVREAQAQSGPHEDGSGWFVPSLGRCNLGDRYIPRREVSQRVADWLVTGRTPYLFLVGPSGIGKTNFLLDFMYRAHSEQRALKQHALLMLPLGSYDPQHSFLQNVQTFVERSGRLRVSIDQAVLRNLIQDGRLVLILDGLDEFARQQGEIACERLFAALNAEIKPPHVIVSCRDHILRRLRGGSLLKDLTIEEVPISPLARQEVLEALERRMGRGSVPIRAANRHPGLVNFAQNPLLFEMMCEMSDRSWRRLIETQSMGKVYDLWFEEAVEAGGGSENIMQAEEIENARLKVGRVARTMLETRSDLISRAQLDTQDLPPCCLRRPGQPFGMLIQETPEEWGFVHDSLRDFALAKSVATELSSRKYEILKSTSHLDYVGAEMSRFLRDLLGTDPAGFAQHVDDALAFKTNTPEERNSIVWNCFEAVGMIATANVAGSFIDKALDVLALPQPTGGQHHALSGQAQFNVMRCLERLHPSAPKPYYEYVISRAWGPEPEWRQFGAWAVRGFQRATRQVGAHPPMTYQWERNDGTAHRQEDASHCLLDLLEHTLNLAVDVRDFVAINSTFALIRWLHPRHIERLMALLSRGQLGPEAKANLFLALTRLRDPSVLEHTSDLFAGMILSFSYLSPDMIPPKDFVFRRVEFRHRRSRFEGIDPCDTSLFEDCRFLS